MRIVYRISSPQPLAEMQDCRWTIGRPLLGTRILRLYIPLLSTV